MFARLVAAAALALTASPPLSSQSSPPQSPPPRQTFKNFNRTYQIDLPAGWRQIAPNEAVQLSENPAAPRDVHPAPPTHQYSVGPIDAWLDGDFSGPWIQVIERRDDYYIPDDVDQMLREHWRTVSEQSGVHHLVGEVTQEKLGTQAVDCILATRTTTVRPEGSRGAGAANAGTAYENRTATRSLDVHFPTARQQITLSFTCPEDQFDRWQPEFRTWLDSLTLARPAQDPVTLVDRLWTPLLVGGGVGLVLLLLYKHTRSQR